jgi:hypothetical protein
VTNNASAARVGTTLSMLKEQRFAYDLITDSRLEINFSHHGSFGPSKTYNK